METVAHTEMLRAGLVDLDATWFIQIAVFLTLYAILRYAFFRPYVELLRRRDEATRGQRARAQALLEKARQVETSLEARLSEARVEAVRVRRRLAEEGARLRDEIVARERARVQQEIARGLAELESLKRAHAPRIEAEAQVLAGMIEAQVRAPESAG